MPLEDEDTDIPLEPVDADTPDDAYVERTGAGGLKASAVERLAWNLRDLNEGHKRQLDFVKMAVASQAVRDRNRAEFWASMKEIPKAIRAVIVGMATNKIAIPVLAIGVVLAVLQWSGVRVDLGELSHAAVEWKNGCGDSDSPEAKPGPPAPAPLNLPVPAPLPTGASGPAPAPLP